MNQEIATVAKTQKKNKWRTPAALAVTASWLALALWWSFYRPSGALAVPTMPLNEWGDWAGGAFAPLAFLWLVVGYFQQAEELRDNVRALHLQEEALRLQVQELKESVEQQTAVAKAASRQADMLERSQEIALRAQVLAHQPRFVFFRNHGWGGAGGNTLSLEILNKGQPCYDAGIRISKRTEDKGLTEVTAYYWGADTDQTFALSLAGEGDDVIIDVCYVDELLVAQVQAFAMMAIRDVAVGKAFHVELLHMSFHLPTSVDDLIPKE